MKIFFFSTVFAPSVGGIEKMTELLCREFSIIGHEVRLATITPGNEIFPFPIIRNPTKLEFLRLLRWCDVHIQANVSLRIAWPRFLSGGKLIYCHGNVYQNDDGKQNLVDQLKTAFSQTTPGIANSSYTAGKTGAEDVILNAYDDDLFDHPTAWQHKVRDIVFLGRLVSQKGCDTLIEALGMLAKRGIHPDLTVIGYGPDRPALELQVSSLGVSGQVRFVGKLQGAGLVDELARHRVLVVPSRYEEPFGIVALEGLASGCVPIVSKCGGLVEAIGDHGLTFPNGDAAALANQIENVLSNINTVPVLLEGTDLHLEGYRARAVAERYLEVFERHNKN